MATPVRHIRIPAEVWDAAREQAWRDRTSVSAVIVGQLRAYAAAVLEQSGTATPEDDRPAPGA